MRKLLLLLVIGGFLTIGMTAANAAEEFTNKVVFNLKGEPNVLLQKLAEVLDDNGYDVRETNKDLFKLKADSKTPYEYNTPVFMGVRHVYLLPFIDAKIKNNSLTMVVGYHYKTLLGTIKREGDESTIEQAKEQQETVDLVNKEVAKLKKLIGTEFVPEIVEDSPTSTVPAASSAPLATTK